MSFYDVVTRYRELESSELYSSDPALVTGALSKNVLGPEDLMALLSPAAGERLEEAARRANETTIRYFGKTMLLYTPMYLSDHCDNNCAYCGFRKSAGHLRRALDQSEIEKEARHIAEKGIKHLLVLTGGSRSMTPLSYIKEAVNSLSRFFPSISVEIYALEEMEYRELIDEGVDGLTIYQEVYDESVYERVHISGEKRDYRFRLDAPERGAKAGMRTVNIGALLGLGDWRKEAFFTGLHAKYLLDKYPASEISVSVPRLRPYGGSQASFGKVTDKEMVQVIVSLRLFLPRAGIILSTRENARFRDNVLSLGVTRMSAGSTTLVGGHTSPGAGKPDEARPQFEISDERDVEEIKEMLKSKGYDPVMKDWGGPL
jgi:2-iminoacetate synthase